MAPPERGSAHPITAHYTFINFEKMKGWVGLVGWPCSRRFSHISGHPSAAGLAVTDRCSTTVPHNHLSTHLLLNTGDLEDAFRCSQRVVQVTRQSTMTTADPGRRTSMLQHLCAFLCHHILELWCDVDLWPPKSNQVISRVYSLFL